MIHLLMLGDSLIDWGDWPSLLPEVAVINRGLAGEMTEELAVRLAEEVEAAPHVDAILIQSGTNNLLFGYLFFPAILQTISQRLRLHYPQCPILINSLFPMPVVPLDQVHELNEELRQAASVTENCHFLDLTEAFIEQCLPITHPGFLNDGVHLSTRGYQVWARTINQRLAELFPRS